LTLDLSNGGQQRIPHAASAGTYPTEQLSLIQRHLPRTECSSLAPKSPDGTTHKSPAPAWSRATVSNSPANTLSSADPTQSSSRVAQIGTITTATVPWYPPKHILHS